MSTRVVAEDVTAERDRRMTSLQTHLSDINHLLCPGSEETLTVKVVKCSFSFIAFSVHPHLVPKNYVKEMNATATCMARMQGPF